jgi:hypothetical protein
VRLWNLGACALALLVVACGGETVAPEQQQQAVGDMGTVQFPLTSPSPNGKVYRLVGATFELTGPQTVTVTDTAADTVMVPLTVGAYTAKLGGTWRLEDMATPGVTVPAQLLSPNPLPFFVDKDRPTQVRFQFKLASEGSADVGIRVDNGGWISGTIQFIELENPGPVPGPFDALVGKSVPFLVSYEMAQLRKDNYYGKELNVTTDSTTFQFGGEPSETLERAAASMRNSMIVFGLRATSDGRLAFNGLHFMGAPPDAFRLEIGPSDMPFVGALDSEGYPAPRPFQTSTSYATLMDAGSNRVRATVTLNGSF